MNVGRIGIAYSFIDSNQNSFDKLGKNAAGSQELLYDKAINLKTDGLFSTGRPTGESLTVYKSEDYSDTNPVYLIKGTDKDGRAFEQKINVNEVNPGNCSYVEMITLNVHLGKTDTSNVLISGLDLSRQGHGDYFSRQNFMPSLCYVRECQKSANNLIGYTKYDQLVKSLIEHCNRNNLHLNLLDTYQI